MEPPKTPTPEQARQDVSLAAKFTSDPDAPKKNRKARPLTARKHRVENINRNALASILDAYAAEGRVILALNISRDIGGTYEVVSFIDAVSPGV